MNGSKIWEIALKALVPISILIGSVLIAHEVRISKIESNRFTDKDAAVHEAAMKEYVLQYSTPSWLRDDITEIKDTLKAVQSRLRELERK